MADIKTSTIGEELKSAQDYFFEGSATPQNTSATSTAQPVGKTQDSIEIVLEAASTINLAGATSLTVEYLYDDDVDGTFATSVQIFTVAGATAIAVGEFARFAIPKTLGLYGKVKITTTDAAADGTIDAYPVFVAR